jgi:hypothetical protein
MRDRKPCQETIPHPTLRPGKMKNTLLTIGFLFFESLHTFPAQNEKAHP